MNKTSIYNQTKHNAAKELSRINATHGNTYNSYIVIPQAPPTSIYTKPNEKKKGVATSLSASSLLATAPRVPPAWSPSSCLAPARVASPLVRTGWWSKSGAPSRRCSPETPLVGRSACHFSSTPSERAGLRHVQARGTSPVTTPEGLK